MSVEALIDFFLTATLGRICGRKGVTPALRQWVLVTEAGGYNCYARLGAAAKRTACDFITRHGPLVHPSQNNSIFSTGTISCPLMVTLGGLLNAGVDVCVLEAFGMKSDMALLEQLAEMQVDEPTLEERIDIGISASCSGIPLFTCLNEGKVFPLLHMAGFGNGSVTLERYLNADTRVRTVVYPTLSHHIKSLLHISYSVPVTMSGIYRKQAPIERYLEDIEDVEDVELYGYRVEVQYLGKASLSLMMTNPPLSSAALPENVLCRYLCHKDVYINIIFSYYRYVCGRGLFSGNAANAASTRKQCLLAQLLNTFGLWNWKFASHVRHVDVSDLPPFVTAVLSVNSSVTFPRHGRISSNRHPHNDDDQRILQSLVQVDKVQGLVADIMTRIKTRPAPQNRNKIGGITRLGGMTKTFVHLRDLAEYVAATYGDSWTDTLVTLQ